MDKNEEKPMFEFRDSKVEELSGNHTDTGPLVNDSGSEFGRIKNNTRGVKKEKISSRLLFEALKSPITVTVGVITAIIIYVIGIR